MTLPTPVQSLGRVATHGHLAATGPLLADTLRALLDEADGAEVEAWEAVEELVGSLVNAVKADNELGIIQERCAPIAAAIRELLDPEDIVTVIAQRD